MLNIDKNESVVELEEHDQFKNKSSADIKSENNKDSKCSFHKFSLAVILQLSWKIYILSVITGKIHK